MEKQIYNSKSPVIKLMVILLILSFGVIAYAQTPVSNAAELNAVRNTMNGNFIQTADIDLAEFDNWVPIGASRNQFTGVYDGGGYKILNLTIEREAGSDVGLFGAIGGEGSAIRNVALENVNVTGGRNVGALVGYLFFHARMSQCYMSGSVTGTSQTGGLVGYLGRGDTAASIDNSYATGTVTCAGDAGGLVGINEGGTITNCYSAAYVTADPDFIGGLVGRRGEGGAVNHSFWDTEGSGAAVSQGGTGRSTAQMLLQATYPTREWDFREVWQIVNEESYPYFVWQREPGPHNYPAIGAPSDLMGTPGNRVVNLSWTEPSSGVWIGYNIYKNQERYGRVDADVTAFRDEEVENYTQYLYFVTAIWEDETESRASNVVAIIPHLPFAGGDGSEGDPYQIATARNLYDVRYQLGANYIVVNDINLGEAPWNEGTGWAPIGYYTSTQDNRPFNGSLNGNGFTINGLTILDLPGTYKGLFAYVSNANISNLNFENVNIVASTNVGTIAGWAVGGTTVSNCNVSGIIEGANVVGGLFGIYAGQEIDNCHFSGNITGTGRIAGLIGTFSRDSGPLKNSGSDAIIVVAHQYAGGLVAHNASTIEGCYFSGNLTGAGPQTGGIVGSNSTGGHITKCYMDGRVRGTGHSVGGIAGENGGTSSVSFSHFAGELEGYRTVGGIVGSNGGASIQPRPIVSILNCYSTGTITATDDAASQNIGGITGYTYGDVINCYSTSRITGPANHIHGLIASVRAPFTTTNSYWDIEASGVPTSVSGVGRQTRQMVYPYDQLTYIDWDFDEIWVHDVEGTLNDGYPTLFWQEMLPVLDAPVVSATIVTVENVPHSRITWEAIDGANSYKIYASETPYPQNWGDPVDIIEETEYQESIEEAGIKRFYRVVASGEEL